MKCKIDNLMWGVLKSEYKVGKVNSNTKIDQKKIQRTYANAITSVFLFFM